VNVDRIEQIKKLAVVAMFSDDELMETLVLKGGNALDIVYDVALRASLDLDFSIPTEFDPNNIGEIESKMKKALTKIFHENGYSVFDIKLGEQPEDINFKAPSFWGGYRLEFKVIETTQFEELSNDQRALRINAIDVGPGSQKTYRIEISKWEYCEPKRRTEIENYTIYVYTPEMIVVEKLRAICQQMPEYTKLIGKSHRTARARDFFDIYTVVEHFAIDLTTTENLQLLRDVFLAKQVPVDLIAKIKNYKEYHRPDFSVVESTVKRHIKLKNFEFYFDYVVSKCSVLSKALGVI
jgi:predicted nucleotidyltransferase component of viral defense system